MEELEQVCVIVLVKDEERNLRELLPQCRDVGIDVVVIDSGSSDETASVCRTHGVYYHDFGTWHGFAVQRNLALAVPEVQQYPWALFLDADERLTVGLVRWLASGDFRRLTDIWELPSRLVWDGVPLRFAPGYPVVHPRLVSTGIRDPFEADPLTGHGEKVRYGLRVLRGRYGYLHYNRLPDERLDWALKHVRVAKSEAEAVWTATGSLPASDRARLREYAPQGLVRGPLRFLYHYVLRGGFLDGRAGRSYAISYAWFELTKAVIGSQE